MKKLILAAAACALVATAAAAPALALAQAAPAAKPAAGKINFATTKINDLIKDPKAKAILEKAIPMISDYYDQIGDMNLTDVIPLSQGALDEAKLKEMQAEYDKG
jgi:hypothetical protein